MQIEITIIADELFRDMQQVSRQECAAIENDDARYHAELGTEKKDQMLRLMASVAGSITRMLRTFLLRDYRQEADNTLGNSSTWVWELSMSERRAAGKAQVLTDKVHDYMMHYVLSRYYKTVGQGDLSNAHSLDTADVAKEIEELINSKLPPEQE